MKNYNIKWQKRDKYLPFQRNTKVKAASEADARSALYREMGSEKKIEIISIEEIEEKGVSPEEADGQGCIVVS